MPVASRSVSGEAVAVVPRMTLAILRVTAFRWSSAAGTFVPSPPVSVRAIEVVREETESTIAVTDRPAASAGGGETETGGLLVPDATTWLTAETTAARAESGALVTSGVSTGCASALVAGASACSTGAALTTVSANCSTGAALSVVAEDAEEVGAGPSVTSALAATATRSKVKAAVAPTTMKRVNRRRIIWLLPVM